MHSFPGVFTDQPLSVAARSRAGVANMTRQRALTMASPAAIICSSVSETSAILSPALTTHSMLGHSTPVSYASLPDRPTPGSSSTQPQIQDVRLSALSQYHSTFNIS